MYLYVKYLKKYKSNWYLNDCFYTYVEYKVQLKEYYFLIIALYYTYKQ